MKKEFEKYLVQLNLSRNTIDSYLITIRMYESLFESINKKDLLAFKGYLIENYKT